MPFKTKLVVWSLPLIILASGCAGGGRAAAQDANNPPPLSPEVPIDVRATDGSRSATSAQGGYDDVGYASWYGNELAGRPTASGEPFNPQAVSAAHPSLPIPSYVEVTDLDSGRTILVRVNDRGPTAKNRLIDLSQGAAAQLGVEGKGVVPVRVRRTNPPEFERTALRLGQVAGERIPTPPALLAALRKKLAGAPAPASDMPTMATKPTNATKPPTANTKPQKLARPQPGAAFEPGVTPPNGSDRFVTEDRNAPSRRPVGPVQPNDQPYFVQIAAFGNQGRATALARKEGGSVETAGSIYRVRLGPFANEALARNALGAIAAKGYRDARLSR